VLWLTLEVFDVVLLAEHVSVLAKYASHLDVRLGELESELRLQLIRTDRHIKGAFITWGFPVPIPC
jgi:hypothetical protein